MCNHKNWSVAHGWDYIDDRYVINAKCHVCGCSQTRVIDRWFAEDQYDYCVDVVRYNLLTFGITHNKKI